MKTNPEEEGGHQLAGHPNETRVHLRAEERRVADHPIVKKEGIPGANPQGEDLLDVLNNGDLNPHSVSENQKLFQLTMV